MARQYSSTCSNCRNVFEQTVEKNHHPRATCGAECLRERNSAGGAQRTGPLTHGETVGRKMSAEYNAYRGMVERCSYPEHISFKNYGGLGISVAPEWIGRGGFERFLAHIGRKPTPEHSIDRFPNKTGNYEPGNVRWATRVEQNNNTRPRTPFTHCRRGHPNVPENRRPNGRKNGAEITCCRLCYEITQSERGRVITRRTNTRRTLEQKQAILVDPRTATEIARELGLTVTGVSIIRRQAREALGNA